MNLNTASQILGAMFDWTWRTSLHASVLITLVTLIQAAGGKRLAARWRYALGLLVLLRLMMPVVPASSFSIFNLTAPVLPNTPELRAPTPLLPATPLSPAASGQVAPLRAALRAQKKIDWLKVAPILWLLGATGSLVIVLCQQRNFSRRIKYRPPISDERILSLLESCRNVMGVRRRITAVIAPQPGTPALFGFLKPRLLLPERALRKLDDRELRMIFLHELAHVKHGDILLNWIIIFARRLHWFNPLVWLALRRLRADRELVCDAMVMSRLADDERLAYGRTLIKLLDDFSGAGFCPSLAPVINHKHEIKRRVTMIAQFKPVGRVAVLLSAVIVVAVCCFTFTRAAEKNTTAQKTDDNTSEAGSAASAKRKADTDAFGTKSLNKMKQRLDELNARVHEAERTVDEFRRNLGISGLGASGKVEGGFDAETVQRLEAARIEVEANYQGQSGLLNQLKELKAEGGDKLRKVILTANYDPQLGKLFDDLWATEATLAKLSATVGPDHPDFKSVVAMHGALDKKVSERIEGILSGLEVKVAATKAQLDSIAQAVNEVRKSDAVANYRPYFQAKRDLESLQKVRDALYLKMLEQEYGVDVPKPRADER